jgi:hypothetical protein
VAAARAYGATAVWAGPLRLAPLVKEHYLGFIGETFPDLLPRYERAYLGADAPRPYRDALAARIERILADYGYGRSNTGEAANQLNSGSDTPSIVKRGQLPLPL